MTIDDLDEYDIVRMDDERIRAFLSSQHVGVLGLPTDGPPSMRPMSYGFDGGSRLYLLYLVGSGSRKAELSDRARSARFLVYSAETLFNWRSVLLTGTIDEVPEPERDTARETLRAVWRPDIFERASESVEIRLYQFDVQEQVGLRHVGLPPGFDEHASGDSIE